jgi:hypothetical protein
MPHNNVPDPIRLDHRAHHRDIHAPFTDELADLATDSGVEDLTDDWSGQPDERAHPDGFTEPHTLHDDDTAVAFATTGPVQVTDAISDEHGAPAGPTSPSQTAAFELFESGRGMGGGQP